MTGRASPPNHFAHQIGFGGELTEQGARFRLWAPSVASVDLVIENQAPLAMRPEPDGWFALSAEASAGAQYRFALPDGLLVPDPASRAQAGGVHDASILVDPAAYTWTHADWPGRPWHEAVIYEVHAGLCGGFDGLRARLPELASLGVTAIELMPINAFPGDRNWGYDGVLPYAPARAYGTPEQLKALIDAAHGLGLMVLLDVVYNHFGPDGAYLHVYASEFFNEGEHTPWGAAIDFRRAEVCDYFTQNALYWLQEYRFDGLRFDATHAIIPQEYLPALARILRAATTGRHIHLILEHGENRASLLSAETFDAQWNDDFHHCVHVLLTGESEGYYDSFQDPARQLARSLAEGFVYQGEIFPHHDAPRGEKSDHLPPTAFVNCLHNHDQIGNRAFGDRLTTLVEDQTRLRLATALLLLTPFVPMLFMGEELGTETPFLFFTSHNEELAGLVRDGRRREFRHFKAFQDEATRARIPDPNAEATYEASRPQASAHSEAWLALHRRLLTLRAERITPFLPGTALIGSVALSQSAVAASWRLGNGAALSVAVNFGAAPASIDDDVSAWFAGDAMFEIGQESGQGGVGRSMTQGMVPQASFAAFIR